MDINIECFLFHQLHFGFTRIKSTTSETDNANKVSTLLNTPWRPEVLIPPHPLHLKVISPIWLSHPTHALTDFSHLLQNQIIPLSK